MPRRDDNGRSMLGWIAILCLLASTSNAQVPTAIDCSAQVALEPAVAPILVVTNEAYGANPYGCYLTEILRAEGLVEFQHARLSLIDAETVPLTYLANFDIVILAETSLDATEEQLFRDYVSGGGQLVAMRPDTGLSDVFGLTFDAVRTEVLKQFFAVDTLAGPGVGIVADSLQYHGEADDYTLNGASALAHLWDDIATSSTNPATTLHPYGAGQAVAFTFDLAKSIVLTRQGNPAWTDLEGDGLGGYRPGHDLFRNGGQDYNEVARLPIPQADEIQRFFANLLLQLAPHPIPRMWYLPGTHKRIVINTGDGESDAGATLEPPMDDLESFGGYFTHYLRDAGISGTSVAVEAGWRARGHETGVHAYGTDSDPNYGVNSYTPIVNSLSTKFGHGARTARNHTIDWSGWSEMAEFYEDAGTGMDLNYYHIPYYLSSGGAANGYFTGSGLPQRFSDENGVLLGVYQVLTEWPDEWFDNNGMTASAAEQVVIGMLEDALTEGYYSSFVTNIHPVRYNNSGGDITYAWANALWAYCQANGIPQWSAEMLLDFVMARDAATIDGIVWAVGSPNSTLTFDFATPVAEPDLTVMIPVTAPGGTLLSIERDTVPVALNVETIKGRDYAMVSVSGTSHQLVATYGPDLVAPVISNVQAVSVVDTSATITWDTDETATRVVDYGTSSGSLTLQETGPGTGTSHSVTLFGLSPSTPYYYEVTSADVYANSSTSSEFSFTTTAPQWFETTDTDFADGTFAGVEIVGTGDACLQLDTATGFTDEFDGTTLNTADWTARDWSTFGAPAAGDVVVAGGQVTVTDQTYIRTNQTYVDDTVEGQVTLGNGANAHFGWATTVQAGDDGITDPQWAMFSVSAGAFLARTLANGDALGPVETNIGAFATPDTSHLLRVVWMDTGTIEFYVDNVLAATHNRTFTDPMRAYLSSGASPQTAVAESVNISGAYALNGTYESSVFDSGVPSDWLTLTYGGSEPAGTTIDFETRTSADGVNFTPWLPLTGSTIESVDGQYFQYRAALATTDNQVSPQICDVSATYQDAGPDVFPPSVIATDPADLAVDVAVDTTITIDFNEPIATGTFSSLISGGVAFATSFANGNTRAILTPTLDLDPSTAYTVTIDPGLEDLLGNPTVGSTVFGFTTAASVLPVCVIDDFEFDFAAGTLASATIASTDDGEVIANPTEGAEFDGTALPAGWSIQEDWTGSGTAVVSGGSVVVEQTNVGTDALYGPGRAVEFVATFSGGEDNQHVGFGTTFSSTPWAMFSTGSSGSGSCSTCLQARTWLGGAEPFINETFSTSSLVGSAHRYRIEWTSTAVTYFVDGAQVAQHVVALTDTLGLRASDLNTGASLSVDWMRMSPYPGAASFESRVFDAGASVPWGEMTWSSDEPTGTSLAMQVRTGSTATPDGGWTPFSAISQAGDIGQTARYAQYRADLATTDVDRTASLEDVSIRCDDTGPPNVQATSPFDTEIGVPITTDFVIDFNEPVAPGTFSATWSGGVLFGTSFSNADRRVTLTPTLNLTAATAYSVTVDPGLEDVHGNATTSSLIFQFQTAEAICLDETTVADFADGTFSSTETVAIGDGAVQQTSGESESLLLDDPFDAADGPAANWTVLDGTWNIVSNEYDFTHPDSYAASVVTGQSPSPADFVMVSRQKIASFTGIGSGGYVWGIQNPAGAGAWKNGAYMLQWDTRAGTLQNARIFRWDSPVSLTLIAGADIADVVVDQWYELRLEVRGANFDLFIDGAPVVSGSDATYGPGAVGLVGWYQGDTRFDDFELHELVSGYGGAGDYTSNVVDSGISSTWSFVDWTTNEPIDTSASISVRVGDTPTPDGTWTAFSPIASSGDVANLVGRYVQYLVDFSSVDPLATARLEDIMISCSPSCGNGVTDANEECDDGGTTPGDGCSAVCTFEGPDADGDGILNEYETGTGSYGGPMNTGTDPLVADSDGDGFDDGSEVLAGTDPNNDQDFPMPPPLVPSLDGVGLGMLALGLAALGIIERSRRRRT